MLISLPIKALSVNQAYRGRRFASVELKQYKQDVGYLLHLFKPITGEIELRYKFHIKNYNRTDVGNLEKPLTDILVETGLIPDDRHVKKITLEKFKGKDSIEIEILSI